MTELSPASTAPASLHMFDTPRLEAFVELMFLAAFADGEFSQEEKQHFLSSIESLTEKRFSFEQLEAKHSRFLTKINGLSKLASVCLISVHA
jgi:DnaJ-domain-containing protein 1